MHHTKALDEARALRSFTAAWPTHDEINSALRRRLGSRLHGSERAAACTPLLLLLGLGWRHGDTSHVRQPRARASRRADHVRCRRAGHQGDEDCGGPHARSSTEKGLWFFFPWTAEARGGSTVESENATSRP